MLASRLEYARQRLGNRVSRRSLPNDVDLPPETFDVVLLTDVLEHIEDDAASAAHGIRLLRPGGIVVATVPAYQWLYSPATPTTTTSAATASGIPAACGPRPCRRSCC